MRAAWLVPAALVMAATSAGAQATKRAVKGVVTRSVSREVIAPSLMFPYRPGVDVQHYDIALALPERGGTIRGTSTITVRRASSVDTLRLDLVGMSVERVRVNASTRAFRQDSTGVRVPLRATDGAQPRVEIAYSGTPTDGLIIRDDSTRGWSAFGDNFPDRARHWLPTVDHPSDKATVSWSVTAPKALAVIANGTRTGRAVKAMSGGRMMTTTYRMQQPIPTYLMVVGVANLQETPLRAARCVSTANAACLPQSVWTFPAERSYAPGPFADAGRITSTLARMVGPFPYSHLAHVQSLTRFGGMENATAIFYSDKAFTSRTLKTSLIAHETAHQWFGDAVTPRNWPDVWLSEGFASYLAPLYLRSAQGDSAFRDAMRVMRDQIIAAPVVEQRPVVDSVGAETPMALLNENSYQKGAFALHMLRAEMGDSAFFRALRDYQVRYRHATANTDDFRRIVEARHGASLAPFFAQWLHRPGWAELGIRWRWDASSSTLLLAVTQGTRFPPFAVPLTLVLRDASGRESIARVDVAAVASQQLRVTVQGTGVPAELVVDPDVVLLGRVVLERDGKF